MPELDQIIAELTSGDDERAQAAIQPVAGQGADSIPLLRQLLANPSPDVRWWAIWALAGIQDPQVFPLLMHGMHDEALTVRECAALALRQHPDPQAIPDLIAALAGEDQILAHLAMAALVAIGEPAVPALIDVLENGPHGAQLEALQALARIGDKRSIPALYAVLDKDSALMEYWATEGLEKMGVGMSFFKP
jgi:HEAT repeat protein